jgi:hypothetical protein
VDSLWKKKGVRAAVYAAILGFAMAAVVAVAPWHRPHDNGPLPVLAGQRLASHIDPRLSRAATELAGRRLEVRCWSPSDWRKRASEVKRFTPAHIDVHSPWSGYLSLDHKRANFGPSVCGRLAALVYDGRGPSVYDDSWWLSWSLGLFAHVIGLSGSRSVSECRAMQEIRPTGEALGLDAETARRLSRLFWTDVYPREDAKYRSSDCRPGGKLDLDPADPAWP